MVFGLRIERDFGFGFGSTDREREVFVSNSRRPQLLDLKPLWGYMEKEREVKEEEDKRWWKIRKGEGEEFDKGLVKEMSG